MLHLNACMLDGFGWFHESDYRRTWLSFNKVDYVFPVEATGKLVYLHSTLEDPRYRGVRWKVPRTVLETILSSAVRDLQQDHLLAILRDEVPAQDALYALRVVETDPQAQELEALRSDPPPQLALAFLANKLVSYALAAGTIPVVGRTYASRYLSEKLRVAGAFTSAQSHTSIVPPSRYQTVAGFGSGLSVGFIDDRTLTEIPFEKLERFKADHLSLLRRHQHWVVDTALGFQELVEGPDYREKLAALRLEAEKKRMDIEAEARDAWASTGLDITRQGLVVGTASVATGFAVLRTHSLEELLVAAVPGIVAGLGVAAAASLDAFAKSRRARRHSVSYLMELGALAQDWVPGS